MGRGEIRACRGLCGGKIGHNENKHPHFEGELFLNGGVIATPFVFG